MTADEKCVKYNFVAHLRTTFLKNTSGFVHIFQKFVICFPQFNFEAKSYGFTYNHGHNVLRLFDNLPNLLFTTSEVKCDY